jgi:iron complex transport system permease protein
MKVKPTVNRSLEPFVTVVAPATLPGLRFPWPRVLIGMAVVVILALVAASLGSVSIPLGDAVRIGLDRLPGIEFTGNWPQSWETILWQLRFPRVILAVMVGASLGLAGATYQGVFRNPLADPYLIGVAAGAGLGATVVLVSPIPTYVGGFSLVPIAAFIGGLLAITVAYGVSHIDGSTPVTVLILAGVAMASLASAITTFLMIVVSPDVRPVLWWLLGTFNGSTWKDVLVLVPYFVLAVVVILPHARILNVLQLDRWQATQLGVNVERTNLVLLVAASLATAAAVSVSGLILFVGLIAPHIVRLIWGPNHRALLLMAMLVGGGFLVLADLGARMVLQPQEIPIGVITALCGAPFFIYLLRRTRRWRV